MALALVAANLVFLYGSGAAPILLLAQLGLLAVAAAYHCALAVVAARDPAGTARGWVRGAAWFAFGSVARGTALRGAAIAAPVLSVVVPAGPLLLGVPVPLLVGLIIADGAEQPPVSSGDTRRPARSIRPREDAGRRQST